MIWRSDGDSRRTFPTPVRGRSGSHRSGGGRWSRADSVTVESGALEFVKRNPSYVDIPDIEAARADYGILTWDLEPGDVYAFHADGDPLDSDRFPVVWTR